ncbi:acyl-CoA dehydrogenase [Aeromicrobium phragmitis]|uniref:Acyl-CoA dehydrogenase n=1 Tax=Aeromicrobium phragmitis TaxID=2478914 RepID=A0A3L8PJH3_9ACTN|nr:acyl-CoA dehydrogenase family protein [Aeromicrobium phragmitis]RLV55344.1 acyl-CoA dehydrogenase [Aeromicrobium phragmitis]
MQFSFSREQEDLRSSLRDFLSRRSGSEARNRVLKSGYALDRGLWDSMAQQLGLLGLALPESVGGSEAGFLETSIVLEELGRDAYAGPYFSTVAASWVLQHAGEDGATTLEQLASGSRIFTLAIADEGGTWARPGHRTTAFEVADGHRLAGLKVNVTDADTADEFVVVADLPDGPAWFRVAADAPGVSVVMGESLDLTRPIGQLVLQDAPAILVVGPAAAGEILADVNDKAAVALSAEMVGGADAALRQAVAWSLERTQFGRPIGSFQAIKHMSADALVEVETARVLTQYAAWAIDERTPDRSVVASMAKQAASDAFSLAAGNNIQIHGGIGFTWEHSAHLYFRKAKATSALFGTAPQHRDRIADLLAV